MCCATSPAQGNHEKLLREIHDSTSTWEQTEDTVKNQSVRVDSTSVSLSVSVGFWSVSGGFSAGENRQPQAGPEVGVFEGPAAGQIEK